ncbi:MAG: ATP-binding protein [Bacteroidia bacterium]
MIPRILEQSLKTPFAKHKVLVILGARQTGKTTLIKKLLQGFNDTLYFTADDPSVVAMFSNFSLENLRLILGKSKLICIDEAQRIPSVGLIAKLIHDELPEVRLVLTGSSSLELTEGTYESLTGRKREMILFPVSWQEFSDSLGALKAWQQLDSRLIYGMYPEVITNLGNEQDILKEITSSYLYKDLLSWKGVRKPRLLEDLLRALALQLGQEVSINELANLLGVGKDTIDSYLDLLEKTFIIFRLEPLSRNLRNEIKSFRKVYFWDNGIRNAVIGNFLPLENRLDKGHLWENFMISERLKKLSYSNSHAKSWFWRTTYQQEIDYIEEKDGGFKAWEIKYSPKRKHKFHQAFADAYSPELMEVIHKENFLEWVSI